MRKKLFSFFLLLTAGIMAVHAQAYDFSAVAPTGQTLYYKINSDSTTVKVVRPSYGWSGYTKPTGNLEIPSIVVDSTNTTTYVVKTVGDSAFLLCTNLTNVVINDSITRIGHYSFGGTQNLRNITIGSAVTFIGNYAFSNAHLSSVTIPESVTRLGNASFYMSSLVTVNYNARNCVYAGSYNLHSNHSPFTTSSYYLYESFYSNKSIKTVNIGQSVQNIPACLFRNCDSLRIVNFSDSLNTIGQYAFYTCGKISSLSLPNSITTIGQSAFANCHSLHSLIIPNSVTSIGQGAFGGCNNLLSVTLPNSITSIAANTFSTCRKLRSIVIPDSVTSIGSSAFSNCDSLRSIVIGASVTSIGEFAFNLCASMERMTVLCSIPPIVNTSHNSFGNASDGIPRSIPVYVPCNSIASYSSAAGWNGFTNIQEPVDCTSHYWDFHQTTAAGSSVYYKILEDSVSVAVVHPLASDSVDGTYWHGYRRTAGQLDIPDTVVHDSVSYVVRVIGGHAFEGCTGISSVTIPSTIDSIGNSAFAGCTGIHTVYFNADSCRYMGMADSLVFGGIRWLHTLHIGSQVRGVPDYAFCHLPGLQAIVIPDSVVSVGDWSFAYDANVTELTLGVSLEHIGVGAFYGCGRLQRVVVPPPDPSTPGTTGGGTWIGGGAFGGCSFGTFTYGGTTISPGLFSGNTRLDTVFISDTVTTIGDSAFNGCTGLTTVEGEGYTGIPEAWIPRTVRSVGNVAFGNCVALTRVRYDADSCLRMGSDTLPVFMNDSNIATLVVGEYVRWIPDNAFLGCTGLDSIISNSMVAPALGVDVFRDVDATIPVHIPCGSLASYTSRWSHFTNFIEDPITDILDVLPIDSTMGIAEVTEEASCTNERTATIEATANYGYHFTMWNDSVTDNPRSVVVTCDTSLTAMFDRNQYTVTAQGNAVCGTVAGAGTYLYEDTATVTVTANYGYHFTMWSDSVTDNPRTIVVTRDTLLTALFDRSPYVVTTLCDSVFGAVAGAGTYLYEDTAMVSVTANYGYHFTMWSDGATTNPRIVVVTRDTLLTALFDRNAYMVSAQCDSVSGAVTGVGTYLYEDTATVMVTANYGYHFTMWSDGVTDNPRTFVVTSDTLLTALFDRNPYVVTTQCDSVFGAVSGAGTYLYEDTAMVTVTANYGYHFTMWSDGVTDNPRSVIVVCDTVLTALFERNEYALTVVCDETQGVVTGAGVYLYGDTASVTVVANEGFVFNRWEETGDTLTAIDVVMNSDVTLTALFDTIFHTLTLGSNNPEWGSVSGGGEYAYGSEVEITATANDGYRFVQWSDGVTENPRMVVVVEDMELTAEFEEGVGILPVTGMNVTMYPNPTTGLLNIEGEGVVRVEVFDLGGRRVRRVEHVRSIDMSALPAGVYYVRVVLPDGIAVEKVVKK